MPLKTKKLAKNLKGKKGLIRLLGRPRKEVSGTKCDGKRLGPLPGKIFNAIRLLNADFRITDC